MSESQLVTIPVLILAIFIPAIIRMFFMPIRWARKTVCESGGSEYIDFGGIAAVFGTMNGVAINKKLRKLHVFEWRPITSLFIGNSAFRFKSYDFDDVREWSILDVKSGRVFGVGIGAGLAAMGENHRATIAAAEQSGLFICVKDINRPEWQINLAPKLQKKWFEILNQFINEA